MKRSPGDIPRYAAVVVVSLVLAATLVSGRERQIGPIHTDAQRAEEADAPPAEALQLALLQRRNEERDTTDLFSAPSTVAFPAPPPPAIPPRPPAPAAPTVPHFPFTYSGRMFKGDRLIAYFVRKDELFVGEAGRMLDEEYNVESIDDDGVHVVYVPLGIRQVIAFPNAQ